MIAAKAFDPVMGVDIHIIQPPGPVPPVPIPHPFIGMLVDPMDFAPVIGATVMVNGMPRATAGTGGKCIPPHIPIGGVFVKPPASECEIFMGSSTVLADGDPLSFLGMPCLSCHDVGMPPPPRPKKKRKTKSLTLPTSVVLAVPAGGLVLVGGPPTVSMMALGMKAAMAGLGKAFKKLKKTKAFKKVKGAFEKAKKKATKNMKPGFIKCKVLKAEPVNIVTGEVVVEQIDFRLPWRIAITWTRRYSSASLRVGICGRGWETPADARLELDHDGVVTFFDGTSGAAVFPSLPLDLPVPEMVGSALLYRAGDILIVQTDDVSYRFPLMPFRGAESLVEEMFDAHGNWLRFMRTEGRLHEIRNNVGQCLRFTGGRFVEQISLADPVAGGGQDLVAYQYQEDQLTAAVDALRKAYTFAYGPHGLVQHATRGGLSFYYEYDDSQSEPRCVRTYGDGGLYHYRFHYEPGSTRVVDSYGETTISEYTDGQIHTEIDPLGHKTHYEYDEAGRTVAVEGPDGHRTEYGYTPAGRLSSVVQPDGTAASVKHDATGRPTEFSDPGGNTWRFQWTPEGRIAKRITPRGGEWRYAFNTAGDLDAVTDPLNNTTRYERDASGNARAVVDPNGHRTSFAVNHLGLTSSTTDPLGNTTSFRYDAKGRLIEHIDQQNHRVRLAYDEDDNIVASTDEADRLTIQEYCGLGQVRRRTNPDGTSVQYDYDTEERLVAITNERGEVYRLHRDALGRVVREIDYNGNERSYRLSPAGWIKEIVGGRGLRLMLEHDAVGRLVKLNDESGNVEQYVYDPNGNVIKAQNEHTTVERTYDEEGNLTEETCGDVAISSSYDLNGNRIERACSGGSSVAYAFDAKSDLVSMHLGDKTLLQTTRNALGQPVEEVLGGRLSRRSIFDSHGQLLRRQVKAGGKQIIDRKFTYDPVGNLVARADGSRSSAFVYDPMDRVVEHRSGDGIAEFFSYRPTGDLLHPAPSRSAAVPGRIETLGDREYEYDGDGNLIRRQSAAGVCQFEWDSRNRLVGATTESGQQVAIGYDPFGRRVFKQVDGSRTDFVWDGNVLLLERSERSTDREYLYYPNVFEPLAVLNGKTCFFETDQIGLPHELLDDEGTVLWSARYLAHGAVQQHTPDTSVNPIRLQGQYEDAELGLSYSRHRYYDAVAASFISQDPLGVEVTDHLYSYAPNVWAWVDPFGLACAKYTKASRSHVFTHGHAANSPRIPGKSRFRPREGGQKFTDEVMNHPNVRVTHQTNGRVVYEVDDLANPPAVQRRMTGYDRHGNPVHGGRVVVEGPSPQPWSNYSSDEVVTQFPV